LIQQLAPILAVATNLKICGKNPWFKLPEAKGVPLKIGHPKRKFIFQPLIFRGELLVSRRVRAFSA